MAAPIYTSTNILLLLLFLVIFFNDVPSYFCSQSDQDELNAFNDETLADKVTDKILFNNDLNEENHEKDFYSFSVKDAQGKTVRLDEYRGKVVLVVNVASECGFTDGHYKGLIRLRNVLALSDSFEVLAFPCNQFGGQEPGTDAEIQQFTKTLYHPNFPIFAKINVLHEDVPEAWQYLISKSGISPNWNFWKYLIDENGHVLTAWSPWVPVEDIFHPIKEVVDKIGKEKPKFEPNGRIHGEL